MIKMLEILADSFEGCSKMRAGMRFTSDSGRPLGVTSKAKERPWAPREAAAPGPKAVAS